jgi:hypothetical protein
VTQLPGCNKYRIKKLMHLPASRLGVMEDFTDIVHMSLDGTDSPRGIRIIYLHGFKLQGFPPPRVRMDSRDLGPDGLLVDGTRIGFW